MPKDLVTHNTDELIARLKKRVEDMSPNSAALKKALTLIGMRVAAYAKINITKAGLIDTGYMRSQTRYEFFQEGSIQGVRVGVFNVPYAAVHEFGFRGMVNIGPHQRLQTTAFGRAIDPRMVDVRGYSRNLRIKETAYLRNAVKTNQVYIMDTIRAALNLVNQE